MDASLLTFLGISAAVIVAPGPDTALTVRNTFLGGRHGGILTAAGVSAGQVVWSVGTSLGLLAVLLTSETVFHAVKLLGAAYLAYLGVQSLRSAFRDGSPRGSEPPRDARAGLGGLAAFRQGLLNNLANPKMAVFFASVLPQFAPPGHGMLSVLVLLEVVFSILTFLWLTLYAVALARAGEFVRGSRVRAAIDGTAGVALMGLGLSVATEGR
jgi:threonine/homoserine/homoserine lactone efflux protein